MRRQTKKGYDAVGLLISGPFDSTVAETASWSRPAAWLASRAKRTGLLAWIDSVGWAAGLASHRAKILAINGLSGFAHLRWGSIAARSSGKGRPWIGVDLDGTLAEYHRWMGIEHIGDPVPAMLKRVKAWLAEGVEVRIFTARVCRPADRRAATRRIGDWCEMHGLPRLPVTNTKDYGMIELWDDRAVQVETNIGRPADGHTGARQRRRDGRACALCGRQPIRSPAKKQHKKRNQRVAALPLDALDQGDVLDRPVPARDDAPVEDAAIDISPHRLTEFRL